MTLLDTNIVIHALRGNEKVVRRFEERAGSLALPAMVLGELLYGVAKSGNPAKNGELLESLVGTLPIIHTDNEIMQTFADQKAALSIRGEAVEDADTLDRRHGHCIRRDVGDWQHASLHALCGSAHGELVRVTMRTFQQAVRGLPDLRNAPQTMDFTMRGQTFTADVPPRPRRRLLRDRARARRLLHRGRHPAGTAQGHAEVISARDVR